MAKRKGFDYFKALEELADKAKLAGAKLLYIVEHYDLGTVERLAEEIHVLEREGDVLVDTIMDELNRSFITPIDREDIVVITELIDDVLDGINSIPYQFDNYLIATMRPKTEKMAQYLVEATEGLAVVAHEFAKFKNSKTLGEMIVHVNTIEAKADQLYSSLIKDLFSNEKDVLEVVKWKEVFKRFEDAIDMSEKAADGLAGLVLKNT
ncbi:DUF47 family protein [Vagococcus sp. BWB3-3]|uniref:DUF47 family protein n=1 Tax=Vagococcus allomyrinae TaxID=2794353 RepID=A0A940PGI3_9ENTE|nr:DUF47 family protein [Vagococcus allomyrinae]MBP1043131.1 DUF47 family protein [Vagococcus allomyrinae]